MVDDCTIGSTYYIGIADRVCSTHGQYISKHYIRRKEEAVLITGNYHHSWRSVEHVHHMIFLWITDGQNGTFAACSAL